MAIIQENTKLNERRFFLMRGLRQNNITQVEYDREMPELEKQIRENLAKRLIVESEILKSEIYQLKQTISTDGDLKRAVARMLINFLKKDFQDTEVKGIFRQGYKILRREVS